MAKTLILDDEDPYQRCVRGREKHKNIIVVRPYHLVPRFLKQSRFVL